MAESTHSDWGFAARVYSMVPSGSQPALDIFPTWTDTVIPITQMHVALRCLGRLGFGRGGGPE